MEARVQQRSRGTGILLVVFIFVMIASALQGELRDIGAVASHPGGDGATDQQADVHTLDDTMDAVEHAHLWMQADLSHLCRYYPAFNFMAYRRVKGTQEVVMAFDSRYPVTRTTGGIPWWTNEGSYVTWVDHFHPMPTSWQDGCTTTQSAVL